MNEDILAAIICGVVLIITVVFSEISTVIASYISSLGRRYRRRKFSQGFAALADSLVSFDIFIQNFIALTNNPSLPRVILFEGRNGGGRPQPGSPFTVRALVGKAPAGKLEPASLYNNPMDIDSHYASLLSELMDNGFVELVVSDLPTCFIGDCYAAEKVTHAYIYLLGIVDNSLYYLSLASYKGPIDKAVLGKSMLNIRAMRRAVNKTPIPIKYGVTIITKRIAKEGNDNEDTVDNSDGKD